MEAGTSTSKQLPWLTKLINGKFVYRQHLLTKVLCMLFKELVVLFCYYYFTNLDAEESVMNFSMLWNFMNSKLSYQLMFYYSKRNKLCTFINILITYFLNLFGEFLIFFSKRIWSSTKLLVYFYLARKYKHVNAHFRPIRPQKRSILALCYFIFRLL